MSAEHHLRPARCAVAPPRRNVLELDVEAALLERAIERVLQSPSRPVIDSISIQSLRAEVM